MILIDQLKQVYVDGELEIIDTAVYYNRVFKKDYVVALNLTGIAVDDPDVALFENYGCGSLRNYNNYCDAEMTKLFQAQSRELDLEKRQQMVWDIDHKLQAEIARPIIFYGRAAGCWQPHGEEPDAAHQQHLQQLAVRGRLAGAVGRLLWSSLAKLRLR